MANRILTTITSATNGFPVVNGPIQIASSVKSAFPDPTTLPAGTLFSASDEGYSIYRTDGGSWLLVVGASDSSLRWGGPSGQALWNSVDEYLANDAVQYHDPNGGASDALSSFRCLVPNTNSPPIDNLGALSLKWEYIAERGADGTVGPAGPSAFLSRRRSAWSAMASPTTPRRSSRF